MKKLEKRKFWQCLRSAKTLSNAAEVQKFLTHARFFYKTQHLPALSI